MGVLADSIIVEQGFGGSFRQHVLDRAPLGYWPLDELTGTAAADVSGNGRNGIIVGSPTMGAANADLCEIGPSLTFDGVDDRVDMGDVPALRPTAAVSVAFLVKRTSATNLMYVGGSGDTGNFGFLVMINNAGTGIVTLRVGNGVTSVVINSTTVLAVDKWYFVVGTFDGTNLRLYINGTLDSAPVALAGPVSYTGITNTRIGQADGVFAPRSMAGTVSHFAIFGSALSLASVTALYNATQWTNVSSDVVWNSVTWRRGIDGSGPKDRTAGPGLLKYALRNDKGNSGGKNGYYSPGHVDCRTNFNTGLPARLRIVVAGTSYVQWTGRIAVILPAPGRRPARPTKVICADWFEEASRAEINELALLTDCTGDAAIDALVDQVPVAPISTDIEVGISRFPFVFDQVGEQQKVLQEIARVTQSEFGQAWVSKLGAFVWENRFTRALATSSYTFSNTLAGFDASRDRSRQINGVSVTTHTRKVSAATEVLYSHNGRAKIEPGETLTLDAAYADPGMLATRVGGRNMQTFTSGTDYNAFANADGTGADMTASIDTTGTFFGAYAARFVLTNNGATTTHVWFQCRGKGLKDYAPVSAFVKDPAAIKLNGNNPVAIDLPCESDPAIGNGIAQWVLSVYGADKLEVTKVQLQPNNSAALLAQAVAREISHRITIKEDQTGVDRDYFVNAIEGKLTGPRSFEMDWVVSPADAYVYFIWDTSRWDVDTVWGFA